MKLFSLLQSLLPSLLLLLACISSLPSHAAAACAGGDPVVSPCVSALSAAQALTGNSAQLAISNAAFSGVCTAGGKESMLLVTSFGCHHLASQMPQGEHTLPAAAAAAACLSPLSDSCQAQSVTLSSSQDLKTHVSSQQSKRAQKQPQQLQEHLWCPAVSQQTARQ
jgi:hypothetical protein